MLYARKRLPDVFFLQCIFCQSFDLLTWFLGSSILVCCIAHPSNDWAQVWGSVYQIGDIHSFRPSRKVWLFPVSVDYSSTIACQIFFELDYPDSVIVKGFSKPRNAHFYQIFTTQLQRNFQILLKEVEIILTGICFVRKSMLSCFNIFTSYSSDSWPNIRYLNRIFLFFLFENNKFQNVVTFFIRQFEEIFIRFFKFAVDHRFKNWTCHRQTFLKI